MASWWVQVRSVGFADAGLGGAGVAHQSRVGGRSRNIRRLSQLGHDLAAVGNQDLFTATDRPEMLAEVVLQLRMPIVFMPYCGTAGLQPEPTRRTNTF